MPLFLVSDIGHSLVSEYLPQIHRVPLNDTSLWVCWTYIVCKEYKRLGLCSMHTERDIIHAYRHNLRQHENHMNMNTHVQFVYRRVYTWKMICIYIYTNRVSIHIYMHIYIYIYRNRHTHVYIGEQSVQIYILVYIYIHIYIYVHVHIHINMHI